MKSAKKNPSSDEGKGIILELVIKKHFRPNGVPTVLIVLLSATVPHRAPPRART
jgi:hypothetical protein